MNGDGARVYRLPVPLRRSEEVKPFQPFFLSQMEGRIPEPRQWLVDGVLARKSVLLFAGPAKIGKSLLMQQMLAAVAMGDPWLGRETVRAKAFGIYTEDSQTELERRQEAINAYYDKAAADFEIDAAWQSIEGEPGVLVEFKPYSTKPVFTALWDQLWSFVAEHGIQIIGLDNARVLFGGSEVNPQQVTTFVRLLVAKAIELNASIILAAHPSKADPRGYAGTGAWLASVRAGMTLHRPSTWNADEDPLSDPRRVLSGLGTNYGAGVGHEYLEIRDGVFVLQDQADRPRKRQGLTEIERRDLEYRLLSGLKRQIQFGSIVVADDRDPKSLPFRVRRSSDQNINQVPLNDLIAAQQELLAKELAVLVRVGRRVLIRPKDGPYYENEEPYLPARSPTLPAAAE